MTVIRQMARKLSSLNHDKLCRTVNYFEFLLHEGVKCEEKNACTHLYTHADKRGEKVGRQVYSGQRRRSSLRRPSTVDETADERRRRGGGVGRRRA